MLFEQPSGDGKRIPVKAAKRIVEDLENAAGFQGYDDDRIEHVQHWIMARAFENH